jgi:hypothetical protein
MLGNVLYVRDVRAELELEVKPRGERYQMRKELRTINYSATPLNNDSFESERLKDT